MLTQNRVSEHHLTAAMHEASGWRHLYVLQKLCLHFWPSLIIHERFMAQFFKVLLPVLWAKQACGGEGGAFWQLMTGKTNLGSALLHSSAAHLLGTSCLSFEFFDPQRQRLIIPAAFCLRLFLFLIVDVIFSNTTCELWDPCLDLWFVCIRYNRWCVKSHIYSLLRNQKNHIFLLRNGIPRLFFFFKKDATLNIHQALQTEWEQWSVSNSCLSIVPCSPAPPFFFSSSRLPLILECWICPYVLPVPAGFSVLPGRQIWPGIPVYLATATVLQVRKNRLKTSALLLLILV